MPWTSVVPVLVWLVLFLPFSYLMIRYPIRNRVSYILMFLAFAASNLYAVQVINFVVVNYWLRLLPVIVLVISLARFIMLPAHKRWLPSRDLGDSQLPIALSLVLILLSIVPNAVALRSYNFSESPYGMPVLVQWPVQTGLYVIVNGGNGLEGLGMNDGYKDFLGRETRPSAYRAYETDIMEMTARGMVGDLGFFPSRADGYVGFVDHEPVYAPCIGRVVYVEDGHPDLQPNQPPQSDLGNRVVLQCFEYYVTVANLRNGTIPVREGQRVSLNNQLGQLGNSGTPSIPHLKVFATVGSWNELGSPVLINFEYNYTVRNMLYIGQK